MYLNYSEVCRCRDRMLAIDAASVCTSVDCDVSRAGLQADVEEQMRTKAEEAASCYDLLSIGLYKSSVDKDAAKMVFFCQRLRLKKNNHSKQTNKKNNNLQTVSNGHLFLKKK